MTNTTSGKPEVDRRTFLYATAATAAIGVAGWGAVRRADAAVGSPDAAAAAHHHAVVDPRAFCHAVAKGYFDVFNDEHFNAKRNRHHGADVLAVAPPAVFAGETPAWGFRLLPGTGRSSSRARPC